MCLWVQVLAVAAVLLSALSVLVHISCQENTTLAYQNIETASYKVRLSTYLESQWKRVLIHCLDSQFKHVFIDITCYNMCLFTYLDSNLHYVLIVITYNQLKPHIYAASSNMCLSTQ